MNHEVRVRLEPRNLPTRRIAWCSVSEAAAAWLLEDPATLLQLPQPVMPLGPHFRNASQESNCCVNAGAILHLLNSVAIVLQHTRDRVANTSVVVHDKHDRIARHLRLGLRGRLGHGGSAIKVLLWRLSISSGICG